MKEPGLIVIENLDKQVSKITINRPHSLNALSTEVLTELSEILLHLAKKNSNPKTRTKVLIFTGSGDKSFIAGADIKEFETITESSLEKYISLGQRVMSIISNFPAPTISMVNGYCLGGGLELALSCDFIFGKENSSYGFPEVELGLIPGFGGTQRILNRISIPEAKKLIFLGQKIKGEEAKNIGLIDFLVHDESLVEETIKFSNKLADKATLSLQASKRSINQFSQTLLERGLPAEVIEFNKIFFTDDSIEGRKAFIENRKPFFKGE